MSRILKGAGVNRYFYQANTLLQEYLAAFIKASIFAKRLTTL